MSVEGSPLFPLQPQELLATSKSLLKSGFPISLTFLTDLIACFISFHFAGKQNIFTGYLFVYIFFLLSFIRSIDQGFAILASKLFGAKRYQELGTLYQRHLFIVTACSVPVILLMLFLGFGPLSSENEVIFLRSMIPSFIGTLIFSSTKHFLIAQNIFMTPAIITFGLIPVHALLCYIFVDLLGMHVSGIGFAKSITDITAAILLFSYIRLTGICRDTWIPWTQECLKNWELQLKRTWKLGTTNFVEFSVYEISFFLTFALRLFQDSVGFRVDEFVPYLAYALFCIPWGISLSMQATIGNMIVEGNKEKVKKILAGGIALNSLFSLISVLYIVIFRKLIF